MDVRNNRLSRLSNLTLSGLQQAEVVDLSLNRITSVQPEAFSGFHHIRELDLSFNKLRTIKSGAFRGCLTLKTLKMRSAGVQFIEAHGLDDFVALVELDLRYGYTGYGNSSPGIQKPIDLNNVKNHHFMSGFHHFILKNIKVSF